MMMTLPNKKHFDNHAADLFEISFSENKAFPCRIEEVKSGLKATNKDQNDQFSIVFACNETEVFEQGVYKISHKTMGEFELFLVPVFGDNKGVHYEAIFT